MSFDFPAPAEDIAVLSRRERKKRDQKYAIIRAAQILIEEKGYDETSINEIAEAADISYATFFNYFPTKDDMLLAISHVEYEDLLEIVNLRHNNEEASTDILRDIFMEWNADSFRYCNVSMRLQEVSMRCATQPELGEVVELLAILVARGVAQGEYRADTNPEVIAILLSGLRNELFRSKRSDLAEPAFNQVIDSIKI